MTKFELWLDESGSFDDDVRMKNRFPSLVGGVLMKEGTYYNNDLGQIFSTVYHANQEDIADNYDKFKKIVNLVNKDCDNKFVVFSNDEYIFVCDDNITYQNIVANGIVKVMQLLKKNYGEIFLSVFVAQRMIDHEDVTKGSTTTKDYENIIRKRLAYLGIEDVIKDSDWSIKTGRATETNKLMVADNVCNTFITRGRKNFDDYQKKFITGVYKDEEKTLRFSLTQLRDERTFDEYLLDGRLGEAVVTMCLAKDKKVISKLYDSLVQTIENNPTKKTRIDIQYNFVKAYIEYYIDNIISYNETIKFINNLQEYYLRFIEEVYPEDVEMREKIALDLDFYLVTVYTHTGDLNECDKIFKRCDEIFEKMIPSMDKFIYHTKYENRCVVNLINEFKFSEAIEKASALAYKCEQVETALDIALDMKNGRHSNFSERAKILGTKLQAETFLIHEDKSFYQIAKDDSDIVINLFEDEDDKKRQYLYRTAIETNGKNFDEAYRYLAMSMDLDESAECQTLWQKIVNRRFSESSFVKLMEQGAKNGWGKAKEMYECCSTKEFRVCDSHPCELIFWRIAGFEAFKGLKEKAIEHYKNAISCCDKDSGTRSIICLAIYFEYYSYLLKWNDKGANNVKSNLGNKLKAVQKEYPEMVKRVFGEVDIKSQDSEYFYELSKKVTY